MSDSGDVARLRHLLDRKWTDATATLRNAATDLPQGAMLHADDFVLEGAMTAVELFDPKMDAGVINEKNASVIPVGACPSTSRRPRARASAGPVPRRSDDCRAPRCVSQTSALIAGWWTWTRMCRRRS